MWKIKIKREKKKGNKSTTHAVGIIRSYFAQLVPIVIQFCHYFFARQFRLVFESRVWWARNNGARVPSIVSGTTAFFIGLPIKSSKFFRSQTAHRRSQSREYMSANVTAWWRYRLNQTHRTARELHCRWQALPNHFDLSRHNEAQAIAFATSSGGGLPYFATVVWNISEKWQCTCRAF